MNSGSRIRRVLELVVWITARVVGRFEWWAQANPPAPSWLEDSRVGVDAELPELGGWAGRSSAKTQPVAVKASSTAKNRRRRPELPRSADNCIESTLTLLTPRYDLTADGLTTPIAENEAYP